MIPEHVLCELHSLVQCHREASPEIDEFLDQHEDKSYFLNLIAYLHVADAMTRGPRKKD